MDIQQDEYSTLRGAQVVTVINVGNRHGDLSSNPA